jgi:hypothetical protein
LGLLIWKCSSIIAQIRIVSVENFGLMANSRRRPWDGFRCAGVTPPRRQGSRAQTATSCEQVTLEEWVRSRWPSNVVRTTAFPRVFDLPNRVCITLYPSTNCEKLSVRDWLRCDWGGTRRGSRQRGGRSVPPCRRVEPTCYPVPLLDAAMILLQMII